MSSFFPLVSTMTSANNMTSLPCLAIEGIDQSAIFYQRGIDFVTILKKNVCMRVKRLCLDQYYSESGRTIRKFESS